MRDRPLIQAAESRKVRTYFPRSEVIFVKDMLYAVLALVSAVIAVGSFYKYLGSDDNKIFIAVAIVFGLAAVALGGLFLSGRVNKKEDIHITE
jgi:undecaprenyl pyrophosphate phosphatase UppP